MKESIRPLFIIGLLIILFTINLQGQTTGKIAGTVLDADTQEPIIGANVLLQGTTMGAATDMNGDLDIINVQPGNYTLFIQMMGYTNYQVNNLRISVNRTTNIKADLKTTTLMGESVIVEAKKITLKKDQTSSVRNISSDQIEKLPVENIDQIVNLQAGVVNGHFRGGRSNEVSFMIDGIQVVEGFGGENNSVDIETEVVGELEVINGTFNAEYGRAMSGVVNAVTKDGGDQFHGSVSANLANYFTGNDDIFIGLDPAEINRRNDNKIQLSGPIWKGKLNFLVNARLQDNKEHLNGIYRFNVNDYSDFSADDPSQWHSEHSGDSSYVPLSYSKSNSLTGKLTAKVIPSVKLSLLYTRNDNEWRDYDHSFKYNPKGLGKNYQLAEMVTFQINHMISKSMFYNFSQSYINNYYGQYVYEDPEDTGYIHNSYFNSNGPGFYTGGQQKDHTVRTIEDHNTKFDINWQMNKHHHFKSGILYTYHNLHQQWHSIQNAFKTREENENLSYEDPETGKRIYPNYEAVLSAYLQDKMEFDQMVINLGIRYDYFNPNTTYPSVRRNPANQLAFPDSIEKMSEYLETEPQIQISPRLGLSYQLGSTAVLHFSYGHFFQMPAMYALYQNHSLLVQPTDYATTTGNSQLKAQSTVQYEVGLWQEIMPDMGLEVVVFYRDIYDLLSMKMVSTYNQIIYGLYTNKDYGNVKGLEVKFDYAVGSFFANLNYTLQYTRGNADNPTQTFDRAGESKDPIPTLIPMSWDQRHTMNLTLGYNTERFGVTATGSYNSGTIFTWTPFDLNRLANINLYPNNSYKDATYTIDLNGYVNLLKNDNWSLGLDFSVYNLFDRLNENWVDSVTGKAYTAIIQDSDLSTHNSDFNEYVDRIHNPSMYSDPRLIKVGLGIRF